MARNELTDEQKRRVALKMLDRAEDTLSKTAPESKRRDTALGEFLKDMAKYYNEVLSDGTRCLSENEIRDAAVRACKRNELDMDVANGGIAKVENDVPRCLAANKDLRVDNWAERFDKIANGDKPRNGASRDIGGNGEFTDRTLTLKPLSGIKPIVPKWVWAYDGVGRIQLGTLALFAGKSGAGKSTAMRWFAAKITRGDLPGVWEGVPMRVAVYSPEEQTDAMLIPGLMAAGADMGMVFKPETHYGTTESGIRILADESDLTKTLVNNEVRALFVDPVMSTLGGKMDSHRSNEVREHLEPYARIAEAIKGIVIGVAHLRKGATTDVMDAINGSTAFVEVPRSVFGFASHEDGVHIMEQVKNSAGPTGLALQYRLPLEDVPCANDQTATLPRFEITGTSALRIEDISTPDNEGPESSSVVREWLKDYLWENQPRSPAEAKKDAREALAVSDRTIERAAKRLGVDSISDPRPGKPNRRAWVLPDYRKATKPP